MSDSAQPQADPKERIILRRLQGKEVGSHEIDRHIKRIWHFKESYEFMRVARLWDLIFRSSLGRSPPGM